MLLINHNLSSEEVEKMIEKSVNDTFAKYINTFDLSEVYVELINYFPLAEYEINEYTSKLFKSLQSTYEKEEYQFSYFALHLIFMTYIYCSVWKISKLHKKRYDDTLLFARPYNNSSIDLRNLKSIFEYSHLPEKDIFEFFSLIDLDNGYIKSIKELVDKRNNMVHATGNIQILTIEQFETEVKRILGIFERINKQLENTIRNIYEETLLDFAKDNFDNAIYQSAYDIIEGVLIGDNSFSLNELLICTQFGVSKFGREKEKYVLSKEECIKIKEFHEELKKYHVEKSGNEDFEA